MKNRELYAIDVDRTLTNENSPDCWTEEECLFAKPNQKMIDYVNGLYCNGQIVIITTARSEDFRNATEYWLNKHKVNYHAMNMRTFKKGIDIFVDDRAIRPNEIKL